MNRSPIYPFFLLLVAIAPLSVFAQPQWVWVRGANTGTYEGVYSVGSNPAGGVLAAGGWTSDISGFIPGLVTPYGSNDGFLAKYDDLGNVVWAFQMGGTGWDAILDVTASPSGDIYVCGQFENTSNFRGFTALPDTNLTSGGSSDGFVARYSSAGALVWIKQISSTSECFTNSVAWTPSGIYVTGRYGNSTVSIAPTVLNNIGGDDFFTAKLDLATGATIWAKRGGGTSKDEGIDIIADASDVYITGNFRSGSITFDGAAPVTNSNLGMDDIFVARLNGITGNVVWSGAIGEDANDGAGGITLDGSSVYVTGGIDDDGGVVTFPGPITLNTGNSGKDIFIASISKTTGITTWAEAETNNTSTDCQGHEIAADQRGNVYISGAMAGITNFSGNNLVASATDIFVASYRGSNGALNWAKRAGGAGNDRSFGLDTLNFGFVYSGGLYESTSSFDTVPNLTGGANTNLWVGRLGNPLHVAVPDTFCVIDPNATFLDVQDNDINLMGVNLTTSMITLPTRGTALIFGNDSIRYTPSGGFYGTDSIQYRVCDGSGYCDSTWVIITLFPQAIAGPDTIICGVNHFLAGNNPGTANGLWTLLNGSGTIIPPTNFNGAYVGIGAGVNELEWAIELNGCVSTDTLLITPDTVPPTFLSCQGDTTVLANATCRYIVSNFTALPTITVDDNCGAGNVTLTQDFPIATDTTAGTYPMKIYGTDLQGNTDSCSFNLEIRANISATVINCGTSLINETTFGNGNSITTWSCPGPNTPGQEQLYQLTVPAGNYWIQINMANVTDPNDAVTDVIWIGDNCPTSGSCVRRRTFSNATGRFFSNSQSFERFHAPGPGTYYIAIDSRTDGISSYDISFDCVRSGITFDSTGCPGDVSANGINASLDGSQTNLNISPCQNVNVCHTLFIGNPIDVEWLDSVQFDLGPCYTNVVPTSPLAPFHVSSGVWNGTYNSGTNRITWDFTNFSNPAYGDGSYGGPGGYNCDTFRLCFTADINPSCSSDPELNVAISVWDDGVGGAGATASSVDAALSDGFRLVNPPPTITCPSDTTVNNDPATCTAVVNGLAPVASDNCPGPTVTHVLTGATLGSGTGSADGTPFNPGATLITYFVEDAAGDSSNCTVTVTVDDSEAPILTCPPSFTVNAPTSCTYTLPNVTGLLTSLSDNCTPNASINLTQSPLPGVPVSGNISVTIQADDGNGNLANCNFPLVLDLNIPGVLAGADSTLCSSSYILNGSPPPFGTGNWSVLSGSGAFSNPADPADTITGLSTGLNVLAWTVTQGNCVNADTVEITVINVPTVSAGVNDSVCGPDYLLAGSNPGSGSGAWTLVSGSGTFSAPTSNTSQVQGLAPGANELKWKITVGSCSDSATVTLTAFDSVFADAGVSDSICGFSDTLRGVAPAVGTGTWTLASGSGLPALPNAPETAVTGLSSGWNNFQWKVQNGACADSALVGRFAFQPVTADAGLNDSVCGPDAALNAQLPSSGTGTWAPLSSSGMITNPNAPGIPVSGMGAGNNLFSWTVVDGPCSAIDTVEIFVFDSVFATVNPIDTLCGDSVDLAALNPAPGTGTWSLESGSGTVQNPSFPNTFITGLGMGANQLKWTVENGLCADSAFLEIVSLGFPNADAGPSDSICGLNNGILMATLPANTMGAWATFGGGSALLTSPTQDTTTVTNLAPGLNTFIWKVSNGACTDSSFASIFAYEEVMANAMNDTGVCDVQATLSAVSPSTGTGNWRVLSGGGSIDDPAQNPVLVNGLTQGLNSFLWTVENGLCSATDTVEIEVATQVADGGLDLEICQGDTGFLNANPAQNGTWVLQSGFTSLEEPNAPETACFDAIPGPTELVWTLDNGVCITADTILLFTWESPDLANAGPDQSLGAVTTTQLAGNEPQVGWGVWSSISGPGSLVIQQDSVFNTVVTGLETGGSLCIGMDHWQRDLSPFFRPGDAGTGRICDPPIDHCKWRRQKRYVGNHRVGELWSSQGDYLKPMGYYRF